MTTPVLSSIVPLGMPHSTQATHPTSKPGEFQGTLSTAIDAIESLQNKAATSVQQFLTGQNEELHTTVLATQKAELAFQLGLQVRNKVVEAYQEIMKMQI